jgi:hypothetical protein
MDAVLDESAVLTLGFCSVAVGGLYWKSTDG